MNIILVYMIILAAIIIIAYITANAFDEIAVLKGYRPKSYFWYCFWLGIAGWLMVVALPDRASKTSNQTKSSDQLPTL